MTKLFKGTELLEELEAASVIRKFEKGEEVVRENSFVRAIPILNSGLLGIYRADDEGKEILLYYIKAGESCIMSFLAGFNNGASKIKAVAEEDSELILLSIEKVNEWLYKYPEWLEYIFKSYHQRFEELLEVVNSVVFQKMDERLLNHLKKKILPGKSNEINITHQRLADEVASTREVVSRLLKQMEKEDLVILSRNKIIIR